MIKYHYTSSGKLLVNLSMTNSVNWFRPTEHNSWSWTRITMNINEFSVKEVFKASNNEDSLDFLKAFRSRKELSKWRCNTKVEITRQQRHIEVF